MQESKNTIEDNRSAHTQMLQAFQRIEDEKSKINKESSMKIEDIQAKYRKELEEIDSDHNAQRQRLSERLEQALHDSQELETNFKIRISEQENEIHSLTESVQKLTQENSKLEMERSSLENQKQELWSQVE